MRVLVVAYYFPPLGLSGVQRIAKFVKYLPEYGIEPVVLTTNPGSYFAYDESLLSDVEKPGVTIARTKSLDPTRLFGSGKEIALPSDQTRRRLSNISQLVFIPDNKIGWLPAAVRTGSRLIRRYNISAILSTAPPYTAHLIAKRLARKHNLPLITDYRDAWVDNPRHNYPTGLHKKISQRLERSVLQSSDAVVTINSRIADAMLNRYGDLTADKINVVKQGFDPADLPVESESNSATCEFLYAGVFYDAQRPDTFLRGLASLLTRRPELRSLVRARFVGLFPKYALTLVKELELEDNVTIDGYQPHSEVCAKLMRADVLWMTVGDAPGAEQISTGKLYEYFGTRKPILGLVPDGAARDDLARYPAATIVKPGDVAEVSEALESLVEQWRTGSLPHAGPDSVAEFDRHALTGMVANLIKRYVRG